MVKNLKRFWFGKKRIAKKKFCGLDRTRGNYYFNWFFRNGPPKIGDITHDCDGQNHVITRIEGDINDTFGVECYYKHLNGHEVAVCPCMNQGFQPPSDPKFPEQFILSYDTPAGREMDAKWGWDHGVLIARLKSGEKLFDDKGVRNEELCGECKHTLISHSSGLTGDDPGCDVHGCDCGQRVGR